jgi:hypothetical protein
MQRRYHNGIVTKPLVLPVCALALAACRRPSEVRFVEPGLCGILTVPLQLVYKFLPLPPHARRLIKQGDKSCSSL